MTDATEATEVTRRIALTLGGTGAIGGVLLLVGCAPDDGSGGSTGSPDGGIGTGSGNGGAGEAPAADPGAEVAALADVPVGGSLGVEVDGQPVLVAQPTAGQVVAFSAICTHQQCVVAAAGAELKCPCHGSTFDAATGDVIVGPALRALDPFAVRLDGDRIVAGA
ncbi:Rieske (2Fe-2S) protein [Agromyces protaetiae]|uniref:Cytochrome bc1 complex Rieske iron-sulfur subunit n=1 Tax=Agromyces protaetiae TaxID=2509455 RepID=A0A4P6FD58_9MICO|nr:Rieske (2Fe-2S) protein [Agromyces protaetiae]QAY73844.1 Rieske (2Fe-2S) protein [Agromyces protaetiae]